MSSETSDVCREFVSSAPDAFERRSRLRLPSVSDARYHLPRSEEAVQYDRVSTCHTRCYVEQMMHRSTMPSRAIFLFRGLVSFHVLSHMR